MNYNKEVMLIYIILILENKKLAKINRYNKQSDEIVNIAQ